MPQLLTQHKAAPATMQTGHAPRGSLRGCALWPSLDGRRVNIQKDTPFRRSGPTGAKKILSFLKRSVLFRNRAASGLRVVVAAPVGVGGSKVRVARRGPLRTRETGRQLAAKTSYKVAKTPFLEPRTMVYVGNTTEKPLFPCVFVCFRARDGRLLCLRL